MVTRYLVRGYGEEYRKTSNCSSDFDISSAKRITLKVFYLGAPLLCIA
jgi:hypothetical protein